MLSKILYKLGVVAVALVILFLSVARAGLDLVAQEGGIDQINKSEVSFLMTGSDGETNTQVYKLPETGMLPDNVLYGFKRIRDYFWLNFSSGSEKVKLANLMADKKVVEYSKLMEKDKNEQAVEAGNEALDKLEYANGLVNGLKKTEADTKQIYQKIFLAGFAYKEIVKQSESKFSLDAEKYSKLISRIDDWNKEQEKNRYNWDY